VVIYYESHNLLVLMNRSLHDVIKEQGVLSKGRRLSSNCQPGATLTWAIEVEKTHNDRLLALFKSVCDKSVLLVSVRGNAFATAANNSISHKSTRNISVVAGCSSLIFSSINMVTDTKLPPEAFRSVHRMFHIPYSCHDPVSIIGHPAFMSLIISALRKSENSGADEAEDKANMKQLNGDNNCAITLKVQTSPKELSIHLIEMINAELEFKYLKFISFENFQGGEGDSINVKVEVEVDGNSSINGCRTCTALNSNEDSSESGEKSVKNCRASQGDALAVAAGVGAGDKMGSKHTHLLQCIYGAEDGIFRWGIVSTEYSVHNRLTAESIELEIENERQKRFRRDDISRDGRTRSALVAAADRAEDQGKGLGLGHCVDSERILEGDICQGTASVRAVSISINNNSSSCSSSRNDRNDPQYLLYPPLPPVSGQYHSASQASGGSLLDIEYGIDGQVMQHNQNVPNAPKNVPKNAAKSSSLITSSSSNSSSSSSSSSSPSSGLSSSSFSPASRAYYKMSEIKEFYFPLWGWVWPGDNEGDSKVGDDDNNDGDDETSLSISPSLPTKLRKSRSSVGCCAVDIGSSPGGWTQCLAAHCVHVISVDPGE
jgi:FtsJ-like methyltransferase